MRNIILLFLLSVICLFSGIFIVDEREVAVTITDKQQATVYSTGVHWRLPFMGDTRYVYTNVRHSSFNAPDELVMQDNLQLTGQYFFEWRVTNPTAYALYLQQHPDVNLATVLSTDVFNQIKQQMQGKTNYESFTHALLNWQAVNLSQYGISIDKVGVVNVSLEKVNLESGVLNKTPESAYTSAHNIVQDADLQYQGTLDSLRHTNASFLDFMLKIKNIESSAKSRQDVPSLDKLI